MADPRMHEIRRWFMTQDAEADFEQLLEEAKLTEEDHMRFLRYEYEEDLPDEEPDED